MTDFDPFNVDESNHTTEAGQQLIIDYQALVHRVFKSADGNKLLEKWYDMFLMEPIAVPGDCPNADGKREGKAEIVRHILKIITLVDSNYNQPNETQAENSDE